MLDLTKLSDVSPINTASPQRLVKDHEIAHTMNGAIEVRVMDAPGSGGASHVYDVTLPNHHVTRINFQNGPIGEAGINGLTQEVLLAVVIDRLRSFQAGPYACEENGVALGFVEAALDTLQERTRARMARGVEGTHTV